MISTTNGESHGELTQRQKQVNVAALQFVHGHTPSEFTSTGTPDERERAIEAFWKEVTEEIKRLSGRSPVIPSWYKLGWW